MPVFRARAIVTAGNTCAFAGNAEVDAKAERSSCGRELQRFLSFLADEEIDHLPRGTLRLTVEGPTTDQSQPESVRLANS